MGRIRYRRWCPFSRRIVRRSRGTRSVETLMALRSPLHSPGSVEVEADGEGCGRCVAGTRRRRTQTVLHHQEGRRHAPRHGVRHMYNPYTMAALDDFKIEGDTLTFNILHEDWADGGIPTFYKHVTAHVGWNEMRCTTAADHQPPPPPPPPGRVPGFSLQGPVPIEATRGNVWSEWPPKNTSSPH